MSKTTFSQKATGVDFYQSGNDFAAIQLSANDDALFVIGLDSSHLYFEKRQNGATTRFWNISNDTKKSWSSAAFNAFAYVTTGGTYIGGEFSFDSAIDSIPAGNYYDYKSRVTEFKLSLRGNGGYIMSDGYEAKSYLTHFFVASNKVSFSLSKSDGWGVANNESFVGIIRASFTLP